MSTETIATEVRQMWNMIGPLVLAGAESVTDADMQDDLGFKALGKLKWPVRIGIMAGFGPAGPYKRDFIRFQFGTLKSRRVVSAIIANMAALLRSISRDHVVVVLDADNVGFGLRHEGQDDMTLMELWPNENHC